MLASISLVEAGVAMLADGRFQLGPLAGRFAKAGAEFIGATAREDRRQRLLADLEARLNDLAARLAGPCRIAEPSQRSSATWTRWPRSLPSSAAVLEARDALVSAVAAAKSSRPPPPVPRARPHGTGAVRSRPTASGPSAPSAACR